MIKPITKWYLLKRKRARQDDEGEENQEGNSYASVFSLYTGEF